MWKNRMLASFMKGVDESWTIWNFVGELLLESYKQKVVQKGYWKNLKEQKCGY
jgi:hypothetical protein